MQRLQGLEACPKACSLSASEHLTPPPLPACPLSLPSELDPSEAAASDPATGELKYGWSNICLHYFRRDWLEAVSGRLAEMGRYHIARKKIPSKDGPVAVGGGDYGLGRAPRGGGPIPVFLRLGWSPRKLQCKLSGQLGRCMIYLPLATYIS